MQDPELSIDRGLEQYVKLSYSENWNNQRLKSIEIRKELTDEWKKRGLKEGVQFATFSHDECFSFTNISYPIHQPFQ